MPSVTPRTAFAAWIATGLGLTTKTPAPGTVGALWGVPLWLAVSQLPGYPLQLGTLLVLIGFGPLLCTRAARQLVALGLAVDTKDPQAITYDEFTTVALVYAFAPAASGVWLVAGYALHRLFDITKPWPCWRLELLPEGWGVMADDVAAAIYAGICYRLLWGWLGGS
ncbi:Phosphatidylglycerophosphatase A [Botrimarina colliarenosi]|uniref:Phosphatidylglycerophosphatase A n=1 Tax=Botrimarina colliarenosi TaxID=2528001 RepID=A0A5C6A865_9BACT|nr:phosphatidylglycerophosphatase A [Botrimarina colliarenosi]TWT96212.1 Phosphatidylglycerophosphatase A [Botrimarina colliarenosi]